MNQIEAANCKYCGRRLRYDYLRRHIGKICKICLSRKNEIKRKRTHLKNQRSKNEFFIYKHLDHSDKCIYVGKTNNMKNRHTQHRKSKHWKRVATILYVNVKNMAEMDIYEIYYINKHNPKYNIRSKYFSDVSFMESIDTLQFKEYIIGEGLRNDNTIKNPT